PRDPHSLPSFPTRRSSDLVLIRASVIALALLSAGGLTASADDGRPPAPSGTGHPPTSSSIPLTELRPGEIRSAPTPTIAPALTRSEEHTSELQSRFDLVCR